MESIPSVHIILINWNGLEDTLECLSSLVRVTYPNFHVIVVDNGSRVDEAEALRAAFPAGGSLSVEVLATGKNIGFTGGNNVGIRHALSSEADYVLCLNNDTVVDKDFLKPLVQALEDDPQAGLAVSKIFYYDEPDRVWFAGASCRLDAETARNGTPAWHLSEAEQCSATEPYETQVATGCALLARAELMGRLGGFDERYFAYFEDVDLSLRVERMGLRRLVVPASRVWHKVSRASGGEASPSVLYYCIRNTRLLADTYISGDPRHARKYYQVFSRAHLMPALRQMWQPKADLRQTERMIAITQAMWRAYRNDFGGRQPERPAERVLSLCLNALGLFQCFLGATVYRVYWFLNAHALRRLSKCRH